MMPTTTPLCLRLQGHVTPSISLGFRGLWGPLLVG